jgi:glyceraldehyde 3-phosphate dehydrogenase
VDEERNAIVVNGFLVKVIYSSGPDQVDYTAHGIDDALVVDNTGIWRDKPGLEAHLKCPGASKVLLTTPGSGVPNIVAGVNDHEVVPEAHIFSAASCTTNAITPVIKVSHTPSCESQPDVFWCR